MKKLVVPALVTVTVFTSLVLAACATTGAASGVSPAQKYFYVPAVGEEFFGTWVNPELRSPVYARKLRCYAWGLIEWYNEVDGTVYDGRGTSTVVEKWTDEAGNIWYRNYERWAHEDAYGNTVYNLLRVSSDGQTLEFVWAGTGWPNPADMDPDHNTTYVKYRRQQ
jgi:hypothetical protein